MKRHHLLILALAIGLGASYILGYTPVALGLVFVISSAVTYWLYAKDKAAAKSGFRRVPESTLHVAALSFGWPGALIAQERLRHKTKKRTFRIAFWFTVFANLGVLAWLHSPHGNAMLMQGTHYIEDIAISNFPHQESVSAVIFLTRLRSTGGK